jgi:N,N'-diacetyllegionaminate synthase|tara:strand:- start:1465 stop:2466 length:1002 start_codon:yes stop_codon:yes gene_type:complete
MTKLIAETAWHHEGDYYFMKDLVSQLCEMSSTDVIKMHITLDFDEYMSKEHDAYNILKKWLLSAEQWEELIDKVRLNGKELMLLLNDTSAIKFAAQYNSELVELHSVCLNVPSLQQAILEEIDSKTKIIIGVGGCSLQEIDKAVEAFKKRDTILMFGFQNYPTRYADVNLNKIRKVQSLYPDNRYGYADHTAWDEENNEFITMLVSANSMDYIEKHVTTEYGKERCDYSAAISIDMFESLAKKVRLLDSIAGDGVIALNEGEKEYSKYGLMKMAAVAVNNLNKGKVVTIDDIRFCRTSETTDLSQIDVLNYLSHPLQQDIKTGAPFKRSHFSE